ncbi:MAG: hypothetical protein JSU74_06985 [Candidatus Zixiibacteriota bacterium]|nr:MAG: hypothetical protein JSU74_06985 [candidate division Zixibacteria bacterium]
MNNLPDQTVVGQRSSVAVSIGILVVALVILGIHANYYLPFISDDALISLRYAERLADGKGLNWTDGKPVEGYSNLLWILLLLPGAWLGADLIVVSRVLGFVCNGLLIAAVIYYTSLMGPVRAGPASIGALTLALAVPVAVWSIGGLEQPLAACLLAWAIVLCLQCVKEDKASSKYLWGASLCLALLSITRLDGILFTGALVAGVIIVRGLSKRWLSFGLRLMMLPVLFYICQQIFRMVYYGEWVANVALVKISPSWHHISAGADYLMRGLWVLSPISEIVIIFVITILIRWRRVDKSRRERVVFLAVPLIFWAGYLVFIGGDVFPAWRHVLLLIAVLAPLAAETADWLEQRTNTRNGKAVQYAVWALCFIVFGRIQFSDAENRRAVEERWEWDGQVIGLMLKDGFGTQQPLIAVTAAGCLPYWSELPSIDMLGLNDYHIPRNPPDDFGQGWIGHELGVGDYVLSRQPDLIFFCGPSGSAKACFKSGKQMQSRRQFYEQYTPTIFEGREPRMHQSLVWVRRYSEKIGIQQTDSLIVIPAYLVNGMARCVSYLNEDNNFELFLTRGTPAGIADLNVPAGNWQVDVRPSAAVWVTIERRDNRRVMSEGEAPCPLILSEPANVNISLRPNADRQVQIERLVIRRVGQ